MKEPKTMRELHKIREELYNETKNLSPKEKMEYIHKEAEEVKKEYNLKLACKSG
jgi:biotin synthase-like enzyme